MAHVIDYKEAGFDSVLDELEWRGLISQSTDRERLAETLDGDPITYYCGFDPTAPSLHIGNLVQLIIMRHLQAAGHHPIALVGGATGLIGDPRQSGERVLNSKDIVAGWCDRLRAQIGEVLVQDGANPVRFVSNYDWTASMNVIDFLRDVGKNFRLGTMLSKDIVARRLNSEEGISFTEFSYQVLQGNDYLHLYDNFDCVLELGGSDQWGNLTSGLDLIHKVRGVNVNVMASPIITDANGKKFGKSEGNAVWLDPTMLSPYRFYQFWINRPDAEMESLLKAFTFLPKQEMDATRQAIEASAALFGRGGDLAAIGVDTLEAALDGLKVENEDGAKVFATATVGERVSEAGVRAGLFKSISEARKTIASGGVYLNNARVEDQERLLGVDDFLQERFALIRRGKKALGVVELG